MGSTSKVHGLRIAAAFIVVAVVLAGVFGHALQAEAGVITNWRNPQPTGSVGANYPIIINAYSGASPDPLVSSSLKLSIDGVQVPRSAMVTSVLPTSVYCYYMPSPVLTDGVHTFRVEVSDTKARVSAYQWTATIVQPPAATFVAPSANATVDNGRPTILMAMSDNTPGTTYAVTGQVRTGAATGPIVATFGGTGVAASQAYALQSELSPGTYYLTATVADGANNKLQLQGTTARKFTTVAYPPMSVFSECDSCHAPYRNAHPTSWNCATCHVGYDGQHMQPALYCDDCHDQWHIDGARSAVSIMGSCTDCHNASRPAIPRHTSASVESKHQGGCGGCHAGSLIATHATTPAGSAYPNQCGLCHGNADPEVKLAIAANDTTCDACHGQQHGDITAKHTFSAMGASCQSSTCHVSSLPEAHAKFVGEGKRYPQYEDSCELCHENDDDGRVDFSTATADCGSCHPDMHGDVAVKHQSPTDATCFGIGCHDGSKDLPTVHASYAGIGSEYGYATTCDLCHANRDSERIDWGSATALCSSCHGATTHPRYATRHAVSSASGQCSSCHGSNLAAIHGADADPAECANCHSKAGNWSKTAECSSCHDTQSPHGDDRAIHEPTSFEGTVRIFEYHEGMTPVEWWVDCSACHGPANLLDIHQDNCMACHGSGKPRTSFTEWNGACQQAGCHVTIHDRIEAGHADAYNNGGCDCHDNDWNTSFEYCQGCHTMYDSQPPATTTDALPSYIGRTTVNLYASDPFPSSGLAGTVYQLDNGPVQGGTTVVVPGPSSGVVAHTLAYRSMDSSGRSETTKTVGFVVSADTVPPVTTSDARSSYVGIARIKLTAVDNATQNGVKATYYRLDGGPVTLGVLVTVPQPSSEGTHTLEFWSVDTSDLEETHQTIQFHQAVDSVPPTTAINGATTWQRFYRMWISLDATDTGDSGVAASYMRLDGGTVYGGASTGHRIIEASSYTVADGWHTIDYWSVDAAGNVESENTTSVGVDWHGPVLGSDAKSTYYGPATITAAATDTVSGVDASSFQYRIGSGSWAAGNQVTLAAPPSGSTNYTVWFSVKDNAGNTAQQSASVTVRPAVLDVTPPVGTMSVNSGSTYATSTAATVNSSVSDAGSGISLMSIDPGTGTYGPWVAYAASSPIALPVGDGVKTVRVQYKDAAGNSLTLSDTIILDTTLPSGTMSVNSGASYTATTAATANSAVADAQSGMSQMSIDPGSGTFGSWFAYSPTAAFTLPGVDGTKTVRIRYTDVAGNTLTLTDTIVLDTTGPTGTMSVNNGAATTTSATVTVNSAMTDVYAGMGQMRIDPGTGTYGAWVAYSATATITVPSGAGVKTVNVQYRDALSNTTTKTDAIQLVALDTVPPRTTSDVQPSYIGSANITLTATDNVGGTGVAATYYRLDGGPQTADTQVVVQPPAASSQVHTLEFWSVDGAGNQESPHQTASFEVAAAGLGLRSFVFSGADQTFVVPAGVTQITADLYGGQGGSIDGYDGGLGGHVRAAIPVAPGQVLTVKVGGAAGDRSSVGAWPNGGNGGGSHGSSGGGSSAIFSGSTIYVEAGAGGGADHEGSTGGDGGYEGWLPGGFERGGDDNGAGGGGGWNGGSGYGSHEGGGDGGTSYIAVGTGVIEPGVNAGNGSVRLTWADVTPPVTTSNAVASYGLSATIALSATDPGGQGSPTTYHKLDGGSQQTGTVVSTSALGEHTLEYWSVDSAGNAENHKSVTFEVTEGFGTIEFAWDSPEGGSWARVSVFDHLGNEVFNQESPDWDDGWFIATVPISDHEYRLVASWYDAYLDKVDETNSTALIDRVGKTETWYY